MRYRTEYKAGDRVRVLRVPAEGYMSPRGKADLVIGDELEIVDPVYYDLINGDQNLRFKVKSNEFGHIPLYCVELIPDKLPIECKCKVWISGCVCGVFQREQEMKKISCGESC